MKRRVSGILLIALLVSAGATYFVYRVIARSQRPAGPATTSVVMAARTMEIGTIIKPADVRMGPWIGNVPPGIPTKPEAVVGRGVVEPIYEGETIVESRLAALGAGGGLAATIPPGMRAVAVRVNDIVGVAGFVVPGMRVDVLIAGIPPGRPNGPEVKTLLQNIQVLSAGQNFQKDAEGKPVVVPVVNLLVSPEQAEILSLASNETRIQLVLRNPLDTQPSKTNGVQVAALFNEPKPAAAPRARPVVITQAPPPVIQPVIVLPPFKVEVLNGDKKSEVQFTRPTEEKK